MQATLVGIDLAKEVFQLHGNDAKGRCVFRKKIRRGQLMAFLATLPACTVAMEACAGAHWLARRLMGFGHKVLLIAPQHVKPFVKSNKSDRNDAEGICEAASRPSMRFVAVKGVQHLDVQMLHRVRSSRVARRTALCNEIRAIATEAGVVFPKSRAVLERSAAALQDDETSELSPMARRTIAGLLAELREASERIEAADAELLQIARQNDACRRLLSVGGVGPLTATALLAACPDPGHFHNGRHFAAWLGLVPRHSGTGGKNVTGSISRRGDTYLRTLLIHGARSSLLAAARKTDRHSQWALAIKERRGHNRACVALANKNARIVWALMRHGESYKAS